MILALEYPKEINNPISPRSSSIILVIVFIPIKKATRIKKIGNTAAIESTLVAESIKVVYPGFCLLYTS